MTRIFSILAFTLLASQVAANPKPIIWMDSSEGSGIKTPWGIIWMDGGEGAGHRDKGDCALCIIWMDTGEGSTIVKRP